MPTVMHDTRFSHSELGVHDFARKNTGRPVENAQCVFDKISRRFLTCAARPTMEYIAFLGSYIIYRILRLILQVFDFFSYIRRQATLKASMLT